MIAKKLIGTLIVLLSTLPMSLFIYPGASFGWGPVGGFVFAFMPSLFFLSFIGFVYNVFAPKMMDGIIDFFIKRDVESK